MNKYLKLIIMFIGILILGGCSSDLKIKLNVPDKSNYAGNNILILYVTGLTQAEFLQTSPKIMGEYMFKSGSQYKIVPVRNDSDTVTLEVPVDNEKTFSVFIIGDLVTKMSASSWRYFFPKGYNKNVEIGISKAGIIKLNK
jgi:hypothetical protein